MFRKLLKICLLSVAVIVGVPSIVGAAVIDNDGSARDNPYGDSKLPSSLADGAYYDCYIPYGLTIEDVGGYAAKVTDSVSSSYKPLPDRLKSIKVGSRTNWESDKKKKWSGISQSHEDSTGLQIYSDSKGNQYYATAIQHFFYNNSTAGTNGFAGWSSANRGQLFDVILTDGTVIHFVVADANAIQHTNGGGDDSEGTFDCKITYGKLKYNQYRHMFSALAGNCLELWGKLNVNGTTSPTLFLKKYNIGSDEGSVKVAYYRMYNKKIMDAPTRASGVGKEVSYKLDNVTINGSASNSSSSSDDTATDSLGNRITPEEDLVGMSELQKHLYDEAKLPELSTRDNLSIGEQYSLAVAGEDISLQKKAISWDKARVAVVFVGIWLVFYGVLLILALLFDKVNNFIEISLISVITFGLLKYSDEVRGVKGYASTGKIVFCSVVVTLVGMLLISGGVLSFMYSVMVRIMGIITKLGGALGW